MDDAVNSGAEHTADDGDRYNTADDDRHNLDDRQTTGHRRQVDVCTHADTDTHTHKHNTHTHTHTQFTICRWMEQ